MNVSWSSFELGAIVRLRADPARTGPIVAVLPAVAGIPRYRVFHSPGNVCDYRADQLELAPSPAPTDRLTNALCSGSWIPASDFLARLTASRLAHPLVDTLYALHSARIRHIPFQFKPLMRLLRADRPRLLIADEVGVGKTIEAGLILKELQARQRLENVLIVCPKALVPKWREEMRRFDEDFRPLTPESLRYCLHETHLDGVWPANYSRSIANLELLRIDEYLYGVSGRRPRPGLVTLDPPPRFSLVIIDEAHHVRTPGANSHHLARFLCDISEAVLFLTATPVHVGSPNLFSLLNLLRSDLFPDMHVFEQMVEPNYHLLKAVRGVRLREPAEDWQTPAAENLTRAGQTPWGAGVLKPDPRFMDWQGKLARRAIAAPEERVRCLRDLEELHTLAHVMNRTRRRDIGRFTLREPYTVAVPFTAEQQEFYNSLLEYRRRFLLQSHEPGVSGLIMDMLERQATSCLPALAIAVDSFLKNNRLDLEDLSDDPELANDSPQFHGSFSDSALELLKKARLLPPDDPKVDRLCSIVRHKLAGDGPGKVLVFSYFLNTLDYLLRVLEQMEIRAALITGKVKDEQREDLRRRFRLDRRDPQAIDVLLSSEVGCEGLDYEFCDTLVNYDIPWNPMRIEQRIGRIDRYGQLSPKVFIYNFITPGTVEERIFYRCFERLGIFRDTVGDLEEVLGNLVVDLTRIAMDPVLTPEQATAFSNQTVDNALGLIEEERRLEEEGASLLGLDESFIREVNDVIDTGRFVSPANLKNMIAAYVEAEPLVGKISTDADIPGLCRLRLNKESRAVLLNELSRLNSSDRPTLGFSRWLQGDSPYFLMTFERDLAYERRDIPFITPVHPLARLAVRRWIAEEQPAASSLRIHRPDLSAGKYLFVVELWESVSIRPEIRLLVFCRPLESNKDVQPDTERNTTEISALLFDLLAAAETNPDRFSVEDLPDRFRELDEISDQARTTALAELRERNEGLIARKFSTLNTYYNNRVNRVLQEIAVATDERILRMKTSERDRFQREHSTKLREIESRRTADIVVNKVAAGILEVVNG